MKSIVIVVGLLVLLALVQAQDATSSESDAEEAKAPAGEPQQDEHADSLPRHRQLRSVRGPIIIINRLRAAD